MDPTGTPESGACDHFQPADVARLADAWLRERAVPEAAWEGCRFGYGGPATGAFRSVYMEVQRRAGDWVVTRLDRRKQELTPAESGFRAVDLSEGTRAALGAAPGES